MKVDSSRQGRERGGKKNLINWIVKIINANNMQRGKLEQKREDAISFIFRRAAISQRDVT